jgi:hypothetical protein
MFRSAVSFLAVCASVVSVSGFARKGELVKGSQPIGFNKAKLLSVKTSPLCGPNLVCITNGTSVELEFEIPCAGGLVEPIFSAFAPSLNDLNSYEGKLYVSAIGYSTKTSLVAFCAPGSSQIVQLSFPNKYFSEADVVPVID